MGSSGTTPSSGPGSEVVAAVRGSDGRWRPSRRGGHITRSPFGITGWQEFRNKWECFTLFDAVPAGLPAPVGSAAGLTELVGRARRLGAFRSLWVTEGLGYAFARAGPPAGLAAVAAGDGAVLPLHTG